MVAAHNPQEPEEEIDSDYDELPPLQPPNPALYDSDTDDESDDGDMPPLVGYYYAYLAFWAQKTTHRFRLFVVSSNTCTAYPTLFYALLRCYL